MTADAPGAFAAFQVPMCNSRSMHNGKMDDAG
jgi:hypothetical protein